jgi:hypothetical protein
MLQPSSSALENERAAAEHARKMTFMKGARVCGIRERASRSSHVWGADSRRGMVPAKCDCELEVVLGRGFPEVPPDEIVAAWAAFKARAATLMPTHTKSVERAKTHPVLRALIEAAMGDECALRC